MATLAERQRERSSPNPVGNEAVSPFIEVDQILDCGMLRPMASNGVQNLIPVKQYLVKWKDLSYLHCSWISEKALKNACKANHQLKSKMDDYHLRRDSMSNINGDGFVGIRPEWTTVDRIIASREVDDGKEYLVRFKGLTSDESYWESESDISTFQNEIQNFKDDINTISHYWEGLGKVKYEYDQVQQAQPLRSLGKRKRNCEHVPIPLMQGEGSSLKVLGFSKIERKSFELKLMRRGVGNLDWEEFVPLFEGKTYEEIHDYGMLFLKHIVEDRDNNPTYSDGVPKGDTKSGKVLKIIAAMMLVKEKCQFLDDNPTKLIFPGHFYQKYYTLKGKDELDKLLLRGVSRHGYQNWMAIIDDEEFGIEKLLSKEMDVPYPYYGSASAQQARLTELQSSVFYQGTGQSVTYNVMRNNFSDHVRNRVHNVLVKMLSSEFAEKYHEKIRAVQEETKPKVMDTMEASFVVIIKEILGRLSKTNRRSMPR